MLNISRWSLSRQFVGVSVALSLSVMVALAIFVSTYTYNTSVAQAEAAFQAEMHGVRKMVDMSYSSAVSVTDRFASHLAARFPDALELHPDKIIRVGATDTPSLEYHDRPLNLDTAVVDDFTRTTGGVATIFARKGDDFYRVATSLKNDAGERPLGTVLGKDHPAQARILAGEAYLGVVKLFGKTYMTRYLPAKNRAGQVVGIFFVGIELGQALGNLGSAISEIRFAESGYVYVVKAAGKDKGEFLFHPTLAGKNALDLRDASGQPLLQRLMEQEAGLLRYPWKDEKGDTRIKLTAFERTDSWGGLVVAGGAFMDEITRHSTYLRNRILMVTLFAAVALAALLALFVRRQLRPVASVVRAIESIGAGDLTVRTGAVASANELDIMAACLDRTAEHIGTLVADLRAEACTAESTSHQLAGTAASLSGTAGSQSEAATAMAAGIEQMAVSINHVSDNAHHSLDITSATSSLAREGSQAISLAVEQMSEMEASVGDVAGRIRQLGEDSKRISTAVSIIKEIADQTNLLALNAAIEAARAGEQGRGFAVVADEVRGLAERTSQSTRDISVMVQAIQTGAEDAVVSMEKSVTLVRQGVSRVQDAGEIMQRIDQGAAQVVVADSDIANALREQASASNAIGSEVERISHMAEETTSAAAQASSAASKMEHLAEAMVVAVSRFKA